VRISGPAASASLAGERVVADRQPSGPIPVVHQLSHRGVELPDRAAADATSHHPRAVKIDKLQHRGKRAEPVKNLSEFFYSLCNTDVVNGWPKSRIFRNFSAVFDISPVRHRPLIAQYALRNSKI
jgi:hypothetical protein